MDFKFDYFTGSKVSQNESNQSNEPDLRSEFQQLLASEIQSLKETQSQSFKNHSMKIANDMTNFKSTVEKQLLDMQDSYSVKLSQLEKNMDELNEKLESKLSDFGSKSTIDTSSGKVFESHIC